MSNDDLGQQDDNIVTIIFGIRGVTSVLPVAVEHILYRCYRRAPSRILLKLCV